MNYLAIAGLLVFSTVIIATFFVIIKNYKNFFIWWLSSIWLGLWGFGILKCFTTENYYTALFWGRTLNLVAILIVAFSFHFCCIFSQKNKIKKKEIFLYYIIGIVYFFIAILFPNEFVKDVKPILSFKFYPVAGNIYYFFPIYYLSLFLYGLFLLTKKIKKQNISIQTKNKIKYIISALFVSFLGGSMTFFPVVNIPIHPIGALFTPLYVCIVAYAIMSNDPLDITFLSKKIMAWVGSFFVVSSIVYISYSLLLGHWTFINILLSIAYVLFIYFSVRFILNKLNPAILKNFENRLKNLQNLSRESMLFFSTKELAEYITKKVFEIMNSKNVIFFILNRETGNFDIIARQGIKEIDYKYIEPDNKIVKYLEENINKDYYKRENFSENATENLFEAVYPLKIDGKLIAFLAIDEQKDYHLYHKKELNELFLLIKSIEQNMSLTYSMQIQEEIGIIAQKMIDIDDDINEFYSHLILSLKRLFSCFNGVLYLKNKETGNFDLKYQSGYEDSKINKIPLEILNNNYLLKIITETEDIILAKDYLNKISSFFSLKETQDSSKIIEDLEAKIFIPLVSNRTIGIIFLGTKRTKEEFNRNDIMIIKNLARLASVKIHNFLIKEDSEIDSLTKAYNKASFNSWMNRFISASKKEKKPFALIAIDLDHFKNINDSKGHEYGNLLLQEFVKKVKEISRSNDVLIRTGGDEFLWFLSGEINILQLENIRQRLMKTLQTGNYTSNLTLSIGSVFFNSDLDVKNNKNNLQNIQKKIMKLADDALYRAKQEGRNKMCEAGIIYDSEIEENDRLVVQMVSEKGKYFDDFGAYFKENNINIKESNLDEAVNVFEKERPDRFLFIIDLDVELSKAIETIKKVKNRTLSTKITVLLDNNISHENFKEFSIDRFYSMSDLKMLSDWAKLVARNED